MERIASAPYRAERETLIRLLKKIGYEAAASEQEIEVGRHSGMAEIKS